MFLFILIGCICLYAYLKTKSIRHPPLPPGPPADPIIGHLRLIPPDNQETLFYKWGKIYGDVMHLDLLGRSVIVLNSVKAAVDLLDKRSANYSDRPRFVLFDMMGWESGMTFLPYGRRFQRHRRMLQHYLTPNKCVGYQPIQSREARVLLQNLLEDSESRDAFIRRFSTAIIMRLAYGHQITSDDDPYVKIAEDTGYALSNGGPPGSTPVDFFPFLRKFPAWFPGAYYAGFARNNKFAIDRLHNYPFEEVSAQMVRGKAKPSFLASQLEARIREGNDAQNTIADIKGAAGVMYCAAADTTWSTLSMFFLAMVLNPEHQARAQKEIDMVVGSGRLPEFEDRLSLPYVECLLQETLRWNAAVPLGVPHRSLEDDVYEGMFIPKGSLVIANTRGMTLDERVYSDPAMFNPARFLPKPEGNAEPHPSGPFGFGRRICPGRHLADASLWIAMVSVLATMDITKAVDADGKEVTPEVAFSSGITSHPRPYRCAIRPRSDTARVLIEHSDTSDTY
ncbi:cytochrome P450 CYP621A2 [Collybia nuda]|uniref:Cytochrome P450 CYP621A2 n=1 Tax=Collybia nuda TaxID=64659 RepID=A0A9P6CFW4_9AGAR|nr:cytochrome P450 CYP621A2 [Collybia nuda]